MSDDGQIVWEDPPPIRFDRPHRPGKWVAILTPLMERPGQWARINAKQTAKAARAAQQNLKRGIHRRPPGRWEFVQRRIDEETWGIYARYLGPDEEVGS